MGCQEFGRDPGVVLVDLHNPIARLSQDLSRGASATGGTTRQALRLTVLRSNPSTHGLALGPSLWSL